MNLSHSLPRTLGLAALPLAVTIGIGACGPNPGPPVSEFQARVSVLNKSNEMHVLRIRELRPEVQLDCERVAQAPAEHLADDAFGAPVRWPLYSDQEIGLGAGSRDWWGGDDLDGRGCNATLIQSDTVADIVVFWDGSLVPKRFAFDPDIPQQIKPDPQTVVLWGDYERVAESEMKPYRLRPCEDQGRCGDAAETQAARVPPGARYYWESVWERPLHFAQPWQPDERPQTPAQQCEMPGAATSLVWETPPSTSWEVYGIREGLDGCHTLELRRFGAHDIQEDYVVCAPFAALNALAPRRDASVLATFERDTGTPVAGLNISVRYDLNAGGFGGNVDIYLSRGQHVRSAAHIDLGIEDRAECGPVETECGQMELPVDVRLGEHGVLSAGESMSLENSSLEVYEVHLVRALRRSVVDNSCAEDVVARSLEGRPGPYFEAVTVIGD
jgi:hypothetical protein